VPETRAIAWNIDGKWQQNRVALHTVEFRELQGGDDDTPYPEAETPLPLPFREGKDGSDTIYIQTSGGAAATPEMLEQGASAVPEQDVNILALQLPSQTPSPPPTQPRPPNSGVFAFAGTTGRSLSTTTECRRRECQSGGPFVGDKETVGASDGEDWR